MQKIEIMEIIINQTGLTLSVIGYAFIVLVIAGFVRGYSGFGFSALTVTALSIVLLPREIVPVVLCLEIFASIHILPKAWRQADWRLIGWLVVGAAIATPIGVWILANLPERPMRIALCLVVLGLSLFLLQGSDLRNPHRSLTRFSVGLVSGLFNGAAAIGGLPVVLFLIAAAAEAAALRATIASYFLFTEFVALGSAYASGLVDEETLWRLGLFILPMVIGVQLGSRHFFNANPETFKRFALCLLILLSITGLVRAVIY